MFCINIFFSPLCLVDEPSVPKFATAINKVLLFVLTLFLLEVSSFFWLHKQEKKISFCWYRVEIRTLFLFVCGLLYPEQQHFCITAQCHVLVFVTRWCYWYHSQYIYLFASPLPDAFCVFLFLSPGFHLHFIVTAVILSAVSHWWVMMVELGKLVVIKFGMTHHLATSRQLH